MSGKLFIGTSGWSYDHWRDIFYPAGLASAKRLEYYSRHFNTVEVNATFYRLPRDTTFEKWRTGTPDDFVFALKASRLITHNKKLRGVKPDVSKFLAGAQILGGKLGPILFQLPPSLKKNVRKLSSFLRLLPKGCRFAVEYRNDTWADDEVYDILEDSGVAYCMVSAPGLASIVKATADFAYVRFHGSKKWYAHLYTWQEISWWAKHLENFLKDGIDVHAYFNNDFEGYAVRNATELRKMLTG